MSKIEPRTLKGFRDFLPDHMRLRKFVIQTISQVFEKYGYEPLETPTLEYANILMGKYGEEEKLIYHFKDHGDRDVAMKYDLTVPAARVMAQYQNDLPLPFKRYQIQPVWRAENTQRGRYRELWQCDADTFGSASTIVEAEYIQLGIEVFHLLGFQNYYARINNRKLLESLVRHAGASADQFTPVAICIDKVEKVGWDKVIEEMIARGVDLSIGNKVKELLSVEGSNKDNLQKFAQLNLDEEGQEGLNELQEIFSYLTSVGISENFVKFDPLIVRGLAYYTGTVWEWGTDDKTIGSLGGGGRYDKLIGLFLGKDVPAAGGSFGIERIIDVMQEKNMHVSLQNDIILVTVFDESTREYSVKIAQKLRDAGKKVMLYPSNDKLEKQLKYADKKGIKEVVIAGPDEVKENKYKIKNFASGEEKYETC